MTTNPMLQRFPLDGVRDSDSTCIVSFRFPLKMKELIEKVARDGGNSSTAYVEDAVVTKLLTGGYLPQSK